MYKHAEAVKGHMIDMKNSYTTYFSSMEHIMKNCLYGMETRRSILFEELSQCSDEIQTIQQNLQEKEQRLSELEVKVVDTSQKVVDTSQKLQDLKDTYKKDRHEIREINNELQDSLTEVYDDLDSKRTACKDHVNNLEKSIRNVCDTMKQNAQNEADGIIRTAQVENDQIRLELDTIRINLEEREKAVREKEVLHNPHRLVEKLQSIAADVKKRGDGMNDDPLLCNICYSNTINAVMNCGNGHTLCDECALNIVYEDDDKQHCPMCRNVCEGFTKITVC